ncbi:hypothetical protein B5M42_013805 [Paenibacillus athensensis]|nr:hypothetical protein [Paenibacillus athensensis]MCD1259907.1 hypothetical protein [Paenibacillus athensensis]
MKNFNKCWAIAGGWSIDMFIGKVTRHHDDIEIIVFRQDQLSVQMHLAGWIFKKVENGIVSPWNIGEMLLPPVHETYAEKDGEKIEILLNESDGDHWVYRRDARITREFKKTILFSSQGIPFLCPEITLLYKSKNPRLKDTNDFYNTFNHMGSDQKNWFSESLRILYKEHTWL